MISSIMPYVCLYSFYFFASWWLLTKLFEKRMKPEARGILFYLFVLFLPQIVSVILSLVLKTSPLNQWKADFDPNWISFSKSMASIFIFVHALIWFYAVKCLKKKNEIFIPKIPMRRASDFAIYFALAGTILVLTVLPWSLL